MIQNDKVNFIRYLLWQLNFFLQSPRRIITLVEFEVLIHTIHYQVFSGRDNSFVQKEKQLTFLMIYISVF